MAKQPDELTAHPVAALWRSQDEDEYALLLDSIREQGLLEPIEVDDKGRIVDGLNRYRACKELGIEPTYRRYEGGNVYAFIRAKNGARRHMKPGALVLTLEMMRRAEEEETGKKSPKKDFSEENNIDRQRLMDAGAVLDFSIDDDLVEDVLSGAKGLQAAAEIARERKAVKKAREAKIERLKKQAKDLAKLVADDAMDVDEAIAALELREAKAREEAALAKSEAERAAAEAAEAKRQARWCATNNLLDALTVLTMPASHAEDLVAHFDADTAAMRKEKVSQDRLDAAAETMKAIADAWRRKEQAVFSEAAE